MGIKAEHSGGMQYVIDEDGNKTAVVIPIEHWETVVKPLWEQMEFKEEILNSLQSVKLHMEGKVELKSAREFLNEL